MSNQSLSNSIECDKCKQPCALLTQIIINDDELKSRMIELPADNKMYEYKYHCENCKESFYLWTKGEN